MIINLELIIKELIENSIYADVIAYVEKNALKIFTDNVYFVYFYPFYDHYVHF